MLYELLTGAVPFDHPTPVALMTMHVLNSPRALQEVDPSLPEVVASLIGRMLTKTPAARPTMAQVASRLQY